MIPIFSGRALTVRNPWPFAIRFLGKDIENRTRPAPAELVGKWIALHTGRAPVLRDDLRDMLGMANRAGWSAVERGPGIVDLYADGRPGVRATPALMAPQALIPGVFRIHKQYDPHRGWLGGWRAPDQWGYHIEYRALPEAIECGGPTPKPGKRGSMNLGWWRVPVDVAARITAMLPEVAGG